MRARQIPADATIKTSRLRLKRGAALGLVALLAVLEVDGRQKRNNSAEDLAGPEPKAGLPPAAARPPTAAAPPSILLVTIDTLRADHVGCYGGKGAETLNLDSLARQGVRFDEARSHVPLTLPSHATILTGLLPPHHGVRANDLFPLRANVPTLATVLRAKGYATAAIVASVVLDRTTGLDRGFDRYDDNQRVGERSTFEYLERGASQIADSAARELAGLKPPFFLWVHMYDPHRPLVPPAPFRARHAGSLYDGEIAFADAAFGEIRQRASERAGGNLIVAALSDHGESLGQHGENQHGYTLHRGVLRVPLILAGPGLPRARTIAETAGLVDLAPTLAELAGTSIPGSDGKSLVSLWVRSSPDAAAKARRPAEKPGAPGQSSGTWLWEETLHPLYDSGWAPLRGILTDRWHFVEAPRPELYDRARDPDDRTDLSAKQPEIVDRMRRRLAAIGSALGDVAEPEGAGEDSPEAAERREKLAALGYLSGAAGPSEPAPRLDPKDGLPGFLAIEASEEMIEAGGGRKAADLLEPFTRKDPRNPRLWHQLGKALAVAGELDGADRALKRAIGIDARSEFIRYTYADVLKKKGDEAGARAQLERILAANSRAVDATLELVSMAATKGDAVRSEALLRASYEAGARDPDLLDALGLLLLKKAAQTPSNANLEEAGRYFSEALALRPDDPTALLETGRASLRGGDASGAIELLGRCRTGVRAFECRMELARAYVLGPRDLASARATLEAARAIAADDAMRLEVDVRLQAIATMERGN